MVGDADSSLPKLLDELGLYCFIFNNPVLSACDHLEVHAHSVSHTCTCTALLHVDAHSFEFILSLLQCYFVEVLLDTVM